MPNLIFFDCSGPDWNKVFPSLSGLKRLQGTDSTWLKGKSKHIVLLQDNCCWCLVSDLYFLFSWKNWIVGLALRGSNNIHMKQSEKYKIHLLILHIQPMTRCWHCFDVTLSPALSWWVENCRFNLPHAVGNTVLSVLRLSDVFSSVFCFVLLCCVLHRLFSFCVWLSWLVFQTLPEAIFCCPCFDNCCRLHQGTKSRSFVRF